MTTKEKRPVLTGQRLRSRKRDEKQKYDAEGFRDDIVEGLNGCEDLEQGSKFLDGTGLDYRRYAEPLFDIIIAGGLLEPGGSLSEGDQLKQSVFSCEPDDLPKVIQMLIINVVRRFKYLQVHLEEETAKLIKFLKGFSKEDRTRLAELVARLLAEGIISAKPLLSLSTESVVKDGLSGPFLVDLFTVWLKLSSIGTIAGVLKKGQADVNFMSFFPRNDQTYERLSDYFGEHGLDDVVSWLNSQRMAGVKREIVGRVAVSIKEEEKDVDEVLEIVQELVKGIDMEDTDIIPSVFYGFMDGEDWNKKADLVGDQALRHLKSYYKLLKAYCRTEAAQVLLMVKVQIYFFENQNFLKVFDKFILLLYKADVLGEDAILKWYEGGHSSKGKGVFLESLKKMVEWLRSAEEESSDEED